MAGLPPEVEATLLRGLGAYLRDVPRNELPTKLRPLAGRHQKMLVARKEEILGSLEDDAFRALVVQWLDDNPPLKRTDAQMLRLAAERSDGWEDALAKAFSSTSVPVSGTDVGQKAPKGGEKRVDAAAREREKARKARDQARKFRDETERTRQEARSRIAALQEDLAATKTQLSSARKELQAAQKEAVRARDELERERRKARRRIADAENDAKAARKELARAQKALEAKSDPVRLRRKSSPAPVTVASEPKRRRSLPVPKGRFEDAPETLAAWLEESNAHLLVDGYNVSKAPGGYGELDLDKQRDRVIAEVGKLARRYPIKATIVFDGSDVPPGVARRARGPVAVEYSRPDEIADDHLIAKLETLSKHPVIVVTNDRELQGRARALGATIATSNQLLALVR